MSNDFKFVWKHLCHGILGIYTDINDLNKAISKSPYPRPNKTKMVDSLNSRNEYSYALGLITIKCVPVATKPENII